MNKILVFISILILLVLMPVKAHSSELVDRAFIGAAKANDMSLALLRAVCWVESSHKANTVRILDGKNPSYGMCQVKLATARKNKYQGDTRGLVYPITNAFIAAKELSHWLKVCRGDWRRAVASYNKGHYSRSRLTSYTVLVTFALREGK
jgi:hypothetical protein